MIRVVTFTLINSSTDTLKRSANFGKELMSVQDNLVLILIQLCL